MSEKVTRNHTCKTKVWLMIFLRKIYKFYLERSHDFRSYYVVLIIFNASINLVNSIVSLQKFSLWCLQNENIAVWFLTLELLHMLFSFAQRKLNHFEDTKIACPNTITFHDFYWLWRMVTEVCVCSQLIMKDDYRALCLFFPADKVFQF